MSENRLTPCIVLPGIGQSKVELLDKKGEKIKMAWPLDVNGDELLGKLKGPLMKMMLFRKDAGFSDKVASLLAEAADPVAVNPDGTMKNNVRVVTYPRLSDCTEDEKRYIYKMVPMQKLTAVIGEENLYFFAFNSFGEPYKTARALDAYIQQVKEETGSDRVNLVPGVATAVAVLPFPSSAVAVTSPSVAVTVGCPSSSVSKPTDVPLIPQIMLEVWISKVSPSASFSVTFMKTFPSLILNTSFLPVPRISALAFSSIVTMSLCFLAVSFI